MLRGTECHGNLGEVLGECLVSPHRPSAEIASSLILLATPGGGGLIEGLLWPQHNEAQLELR